MSVSIGELLSAAGYDLKTREGAEYVLSQVINFEELTTESEDLIEKLDYEESENE